MTTKEVNVDALGSMKRSELQKLAKQAGIKANMKTDDLISALQRYHGKEQGVDGINTEFTTQSSDYKTCTDVSSADSGAETAAPQPEIPAKVTKRRGRRPKKAAKEAPVNTSMDTTSDSVESNSNTDVSTEEKTPEAKVKRGRPGRGGRTRAGRGKKASTPVDTTATDSELEKVVSPVSPADKPAERRSRSKSKTPTPVQVPVARRSRSKSKTPMSAQAPLERRSRSKSKTPTAVQVSTARRSKSKTPTTAEKAAAAAGPQTPLLSLESPPAQLRRSKRSKTPTTSDDEKPQSGKRGSSGPRAKKIKRDTFEIEKKEEEETESNAVAMGTEEKAALEAEVMAELKKRVDAKMPAKDPNAPSSTTSIPRFTAYLQKSNKKPITPGNKDWDKIHNKSFKKMESIDDYLARKRKMTDTFTASVKKAKLVAEEAKATVQSLKTKPTPRATGTPSGVTPGRRSLAMKTPGSNKSGRVVKPVARRPSVVRKTPSSIMKSTPGTTSSQAKPKTTAEKAVKFRPSGLKPPTKLVLPALPSTFKTEPTNASARKSVSQHITPFKFTAGANVTFNSTMNSTMNSTFTSPAPRPTFDLKASKQKPLTYKPHSGALQPLNAEEEKKQKEKVDRYLQAKQMYKRPVIKSRDDRRKKMQENRGRAKDSRMLARRGIEC